MSKLTRGIGSGDHVLGRPDARVTLVEYGDYECPYCGRAHVEMKEVLDAVGDLFIFAFRHFPLTQVHPHSLQASLAAEAAAAQERYWPMHDMLFENQDALELDDLLGYAETIGLDVDRFGEDLRNQTGLERIESDFRSGIRSGVNGTPTFLLDGRRLDAAWTAENFIATIRRGAGSERRAG